MYILMTVDLSKPNSATQTSWPTYSLEEAAAKFVDLKNQIKNKYPHAQLNTSDGFGELIKQANFTVNNTVIATIGLYQPK